MPNALSEYLQKEPNQNALSSMQAGAGRGFISPPIAQGNIDLKSRPMVRNADGSVSTVRSISVNLGDGEVLIPTVSDDGRILSDDEAIAQYLRTGRHLGKFANPDSATSYANSLHDDQAKYYLGGK